MVMYGKILIAHRSKSVFTELPSIVIIILNLYNLKKEQIFISFNGWDHPIAPVIHIMEYFAGHIFKMAEPNFQTSIDVYG